MSEVKVNKLSPRSGTTVTLGDSGDTITIPSGVTLANSGTIDNLNASNLTSGTVPDARITGAYTGITNLTMSGNLIVDTDTFTVNSSNNRVGIGVSSPSVPLEILTNLSSDTQSTPETVLTLATKFSSTGTDGAAGSGSRLEFKIPDDETNPITGAAIAGLKENGDDSNAEAALAFYISQNDTTLDEAMRIDSSGQVGIGQTSPGTKLEVVGTGVNGIELGQQSDGNDSSRLFFTNSSNVCAIRSSGGSLKFSTGATINSSSGDDRVIIHSNGVMSAANGIALGVGANNTSSNVLNDYEEGTWTATVNTASGFSTGVTSGTSTYTKIGNTVWIKTNFNLGSSSGTVTAGDNVTITNLPFAPIVQDNAINNQFRYNENNAILTTTTGSSTSSIFTRVNYVRGSPPRSGGNLCINFNYTTNA